MPPPRRFPPPWTVEELDACFVVRDVNGEVLAHVYCEEAAAKLLSKDEARRNRGQRGEPAGPFAEAVIRSSVELIVQPDADDESCRSWKK
jgi:hypothetical protein